MNFWTKETRDPKDDHYEDERITQRARSCLGEESAYTTGKR